MLAWSALSIPLLACNDGESAGARPASVPLTLVASTALPASAESTPSSTAMTIEVPMPKLGVMDLGIIGVPNVEVGDVIFFTGAVVFNPTTYRATILDIEVREAASSPSHVRVLWYRAAEHEPPEEGTADPPPFAIEYSGEQITLDPMSDPNTPYPQTDPSSVRLGVSAVFAGHSREMFGAFVITYVLEGNGHHFTVEVQPEGGGVVCSPEYTAEHDGVCV